MMGANILVEQLVENGACDGIDKETGIAAIKAILKNGNITVARALLRQDFETFRANYRAAYEQIVETDAEPETGIATEIEPEIDNRSWDEITADVTD